MTASPSGHADGAEEGQEISGRLCWSLRNIVYCEERGMAHRKNRKKEKKPTSPWLLNEVRREGYVVCVLRCFYCSLLHTEALEAREASPFSRVHWLCN